MSEFRTGPVEQAWEDVARIPMSRVMPATREILLGYIEKPFQEAVGILYDKNILTLGSSCNAHDFYQGQAWISLDWETLSARNRKAVERYQHHQLTEIDNARVPIAGLFFPIGMNDKPADIGRHATALAKQFRPQPFSWAPRYDFEQALEIINEHFETLDGETIAELPQSAVIKVMADLGHPFEDGSFFMSEEHQHKYKQFTPTQE